MPVVELNNQLGPASGIGMALGAVGGYLASNNQRKQAKEQRDYDRARQATQDKEQAQRDSDYHNEIASTIAERNAASGRLNDDALNKRYQSGALTQYGALMQNPPKGLKGQALAQWVHGVQQKAFTAGLTDPTMMGQLAAQGQQIIQDRQPTLQQVTHGLPQLKPGATPQQVANHYLALAIPRVMNSDLPDDQKKAAIAAYQQIATKVVSDAQEAERERHDKAMEGLGQQRLTTQITIAGMPSRSRGGRGGGGNSSLSDRAQAVETRALAAPDMKSALRIVEQANLPKSDRTDVRQDIIDQFREPAAHDTTGLSAGGLLQYNKDRSDWTIGGMDPDTEPDPSDPKYQRKSQAMGGGGAGRAPAPAPTSAATPAPASAPAGGGVSAGKTVVGTDGHTYQQLPNGKWKVIK